MHRQYKPHIISVYFNTQPLQQSHTSLHDTSTSSELPRSVEIHDTSNKKQHVTVLACDLSVYLRVALIGYLLYDDYAPTIHVFLYIITRTCNMIIRTCEGWRLKELLRVAHFFIN